MSNTTFTVEPGKQEIIVTRVFDARRDRLFKAMTDPILLPKWWGPAKYTTTIDKMDVRPGGMWRFVQHAADGREFAFHGVYHAVVAPERLVDTFEFEGEPGHVLLETARFEDQGGKTLLIMQSVFQSVADRDGMWQAGMESGARESYDRLDELATKFKA